MKNIAIDGPAGAGKSTIAKILAKKMGYIYVDTGALYRALAYHVVKEGVDPSDSERVSKILNDVIINFNYIDEAQHVILNGKDVTSFLRTEETGNAASRISSQPFVREKLLSVQRNIASESNVVMDGRDIGTVVLPDAFLKVFLTASPDIRAKRRCDELKLKGELADFDKIKQDIIIRDKQDSEREIAPLQQASDAILVDSSDMSIDEVAEYIISLFEKKDRVQ